MFRLTKTEADVSVESTSKDPVARISVNLTDNMNVGLGERV